MTASVVSSSKAYNGEITHYNDVLKTADFAVSDLGLDELNSLAKKISSPQLIETGIANVGQYILSAIPTIIIDKPKSLVGMGDTISSVSLLSGR